MTKRSTKYIQAQLYADKEDYKKLRIILLKEEKSVSSWFREQIANYIKDYADTNTD